MKIVSLNTERERKAPKVQVVSIRKESRSIQVHRQARVEHIESSQSILVRQHEPVTEQSKETLLKHLANELLEVKNEREKMSSQIGLMFMKKLESATLDNLMNRPDRDFASIYAAIDTKTEEVAAIFKQMEYVEKFGSLPEKLTGEDVSENLFAIRDILRKLTDKRSKLKTKIENGQNNPKVSAKKVNEWRIQLGQADVEYFEYSKKKRELEVRA